MNYQQVQSGDKFSMSAREWNAVRNAVTVAERTAMSMRGATLGGALEYGEFFGVANGVSFAIGECGYIQGFASSPDDLASRSEAYALEVRAADYDMKAPICIAMDNVDKGGMGRFKVSGYCLARWDGDDELAEFAIPDGNGCLIPNLDHGVSVVAAMASEKIALVLLSGTPTSTAGTGMFDTRLIKKDDSTILECWNSSLGDDCKIAGVLSVNGQTFNVPRGKQAIKKGQTVYCWAVFQAPVFAGETSELNGRSSSGEAVARAYLECTTELMDSTPEYTYSLIATVDPDGTLDKVRPRGIIETVWFGPARDLWKDTISTGKD